MTNSLQLATVDHGRSLPALRPDHAAGSDRVDFRSVWAIFRRRLGVFAATVALVMLAGLAFTYLQTPLFTSATQVSLNASVDQIVPVSSTDAHTPSGAPSTAFADTQVQVLASQDMALRVVDALKLADQPRFNTVKARPAKWFGLQPATPFVQLTHEQARQSAALYLQGGIKPQRVGETYALIIAYTDPDPVLAYNVANEYARQYTKSDVTDQAALNQQSGRFLASRLDQLRAQAQADTEAVQRFRIANNLPSTTGSNLTEQEISSYNQAVAAARAQTAEDEARLNTARQQLRSGSSGEDVGEALQSSVVSGLRQRQAELAGQLGNLKARYGDQHPEVLKTQGELTAINDQIQAEIKRIISNLEARQNVSGQREGSLEGSLNRASGALAENNRAMAGLDDLQRRASASQTLYESYLNRYKEVMAREGTEQPTSRVLTFATMSPVPTSPRPMLNLALSLVIGIGLGVAAALAVELLFSGLTTGDDIERHLHVPYVGLIPTVGSVLNKKSTPYSAIVDDQRSAFAEAFRSLRATLDYTGGGAQVIAITSSLPSEGKTTSSICLARSYHLAGFSTLLVDCDLRRKGVSRFLDDDPSRPGLLEVLRGTATLEEALVTDSTGLYVLPIPGRSQIEAELLTGQEFDDLLDLLRRRFSKVVLDTPPLLPIADARVVVAKADSALMLVRWRKTPESAVRAALRMLPANDVNLVGVALSLVNMKKQVKFGYGGGEFHYGSYSSYYA